MIATVAGTTGGSALFSGDGGPATAAKLNGPLSIAFGPTGNLYIADSGNNRIRLAPIERESSRRWQALASRASQVMEARPPMPSSLILRRSPLVTRLETLYVDDYNTKPGSAASTEGESSRRWRSTGEPGFSGDGGPATAAKFNAVRGISFDGNGNLLIADTSNNRIRSVDQKGIITTVAGTGKTGSLGRRRGPATAATFPRSRLGRSRDAHGNLYVSDHHNDRIRRPDRRQRQRSTAFAGTGVRGYSGDGGPATSAKLNQPWALAVCDGALYITDSFNHRVRTVSVSG